MRRKGQINWADLMFLVTILAGAMGGVFGARAAKAGVVATILFAFGGLLLGFALGMVWIILAYSVLLSARLAGRVTFFFYHWLPMLLVVGTVLLAAWLAEFMEHPF